MEMHQPFTEITDETIHRMVHSFYDRVRQDPLLKDVFNNSIGDQWDPHLATMCRFWSSVLLTSGQYKGNPMMVHMKVDGIKRDLFARWLELFQETNQQLFTPEIADHIQEKAERIAQSLMLGIFYKPEDVKIGS
ncbi:group III truncated hemoglobin [Kiloniella majae]|uniref:group III truncated hemoglobin n=1 Tax=Kiloniella majae TaxID=1938558 RepID=UPI0018E915D1|nr:group III truncated hemoglobin [Kiloniella majae]